MERINKCTIFDTSIKNNSIMKALTTSELNAKLIENGFTNQSSVSLPTNKWGADEMYFSECGNGNSYLYFTKRYDYNEVTDMWRCKTVLSYSKIKTAEKHEVANFLLSI